MSQLVLIRHGQAAAFSADSDRLTELGEQQARLLGEHFAAKGVIFDEVIIGGLRRHAQTEAQVSAAYAAAGVSWPTPSIVPGWNEYDVPSVIAQLTPVLTERDPSFRALASDFEAAAHGPERNRYFQRMFEVLMAAWASGEIALSEAETFDGFHTRVSESLGAVLASTGNRRVAVFTSGGPIGVCVQHTLRAPREVSLALNYRIRNASLTEFVFGKGRVSFDLFNVTPHLSDPELITYR